MKVEPINLYKLLFIFNGRQENALKRIKLYENIIRAEGSWSEQGKISPAINYFFKYRLNRKCRLEFRKRKELPYWIKRYRSVFKTGIRINLYYIDVNNCPVRRSLHRLLEYDENILRTFFTKIDLTNLKS